MCHEDDAIMHEVAIMHSPHYATNCIIASSKCATLKDASSAGRHNCFIAGLGTLPFYRCGLISKSAITTYCTLKCALSDLMH